MKTRSLLLALCVLACTPETAQRAQPLNAPVPLCIEPSIVAVPTPADLAVPALPPLGDGLDASGIKFTFHANGKVGRTGAAVFATDLDQDDPDRRLSVVDKTFGRLTVRVQTAAIAKREIDGMVTLSTGGEPIGDSELHVTYQVEKDRNIRVSALSLLGADTQVQLDSFHPELTLTFTPGTCEEFAIVGFGPFPYGMPTVKWPEIKDCNQDKCIEVAGAWLRLSHNVWRANQLFGVLAQMAPAQREFFWYRGGIDPDGDPVGERSSPAYWYGDFDSDRYETIKEVMADFSRIVTKAKHGAISLRLQCPDYSKNPGNVCFSSSTFGHHWVKGWVNICDNAFSDTGCAVSAVDEVMHHEPLHHTYVNHNGPKILTDLTTHWHGNSCLSSPSTASIYCEFGNDGDNVRHLATYTAGDGGNCNHRKKNALIVDSHALFIRVIGTMVDDHTMTWWPEPSPPTPTPPDCFGSPGCQCEPLNGSTPDGDYSSVLHCPDNEGLSVCMTTVFNASDTVGICTLCDEYRGPGCPCDLNATCQRGVCFGGGVDNSDTGTCYLDPPPLWGCLADCEAVMGNGGFCIYDHPGRARCNPVGTTLPEAYNCWIDGGYMDPQTLSCETGQCGALAGGVTCDQLGYPAYYTCDAAFRCVPNP